VLRIHDLSGRVVRTLTDRSWPAGRHQLEWDGIDRDGRPAPAGLYFGAIEESGGFRAHHPLVRLK
jgi:flagellar hook assembly protein FlgD